MNGYMQMPGQGCLRGDLVTSVMGNGGDLFLIVHPLVQVGFRTLVHVLVKRLN